MLYFCYFLVCVPAILPTVQRNREIIFNIQCKALIISRLYGNVVVMEIMLFKLCFNVLIIAVIAIFYVFRYGVPNVPAVGVSPVNLSTVSTGI